MFTSSWAKDRWFRHAALLLPAVLLGVAPPARAQADGIAFDELLPDDTLALIHVRDCQAIAERPDALPWQALLSTPELAHGAEIAGWIASWDNLVAGQLGVSFREVIALGRGQAALAVRAPRDSLATGMPIILLAELGEDNEASEALAERASAALRAAGYAARSEETSGTTLRVFMKPSAEMGSSARIAAWAVHGSLLIASSDADTVRGILARWSTGAARSLARKPAYERVMGAAPEPARIRWYLDAHRLLEMASPLLEIIGGGKRDDIVAALDLSGLGSVWALGGGLALGTDRWDALAKTAVFWDGPAQPLGKLAAFSGEDLAPPAWVPADIASYASASWDPRRILQTTQLFGAALRWGTPAELLERWLGAGTGVDPESELVAPLGRRAILLTDRPKPGGAPGQLLALELADPATMSSSIAKLMPRVGKPCSRREIEHESLYECSLPPWLDPLPAAVPLFAPPRRVTVTVALGYLMIGSDAELVERVLRSAASGADGLDTDPDYRAVAGQFPVGVGQVTFTRLAGAPVPTPAVRAADAVRAATAPLPVGATPAALPATLHLISALASHRADGWRRAPSGSYTVQDETGLLHVRFTPRATHAPALPE